ncbi:MAG: hypothetical protein JNM56_04455 [Planctomycetia bacterium]|nr:hypothetical protein [Planctomycetia bacterium]
MPMIREFQGKIVRRTLAVGDMIAVAFYSRVEGQPGERALLPVAEYRAGLKSRFEPDPEGEVRNGKRPNDNGHNRRSPAHLQPSSRQHGRSGR